MPQPDYLLATTSEIRPTVVQGIGTAYVVTNSNFPVLTGATCYVLEMWEESLRLTHWHPNSSELGYVVAGEIQIILWRSPGETAVFTVGAGMCWFIPQGALHSINNLGNDPAKLLVGFSNCSPSDMDLPVAYNGIPLPIRNALGHAPLRDWVGVATNPLFGHGPVNNDIRNIKTGSPYSFDLAKVTPLFEETRIGSVVWGVKSNWSILQDISVLRARLKPNVARDVIWYPDASTLYVVTKGSAKFYIIQSGQSTNALQATIYNFVFVPMGVEHTFINTGTDEFEVIAFFSKADTLPEVSLSVATAFFPKSLSKAAMTDYGDQVRPGDPLARLQYKTVNPYLLKLQ